MIQDKIHTTYTVMEQKAGLAGKTVLEIGCGSGRLTGMYADHTATTIGIEPDPRVVEQAVDKVPDATFLCGTGMALPFANNRFDIVLFSLSLHHHPHYQRALHEAERVTREQGLILVLEPTIQSQIQQLCKVFEDEDHRLTAVRDMLPHSGLDIISERTFDTHWEFDNFADVKEYAFSYYNHAPDRSKEEAIERFLGTKAQESPIMLSDTLCLTTLRPRTHHLLNEE